MIDMDKMLAERKKQHGDFGVHAEATQALKTVLYSYYDEHHTPIHREALEMIVHKIGRILTGNPNHCDHWDDIAGYAKITSDRIPEHRRHD